MKPLSRQGLIKLVAAIAIAVTAAALILLPPVLHRNSGDGTLAGTVTLYPIGPVCSEHSQCSRPASDQLVTISRSDGSSAAKSRTNGSGHYAFSLSPGSYTVLVPAERYGRAGTNIPNPIKITAGQTATVDITIDTGIR